MAETILGGAARHCPDCKEDVLEHLHIKQSSRYALWTSCNCASSYSRESEYYLSREDIQIAIQLGTIRMREAPVQDAEFVQEYTEKLLKLGES